MIDMPNYNILTKIVNKSNIINCIYIDEIYHTSLRGLNLFILLF